MALLSNVRLVVALGQIAFGACLRLAAGRGFALPRPLPRFGHGLEYRLADGWPLLLVSYHPSRQNTQTGRLTQDMLDAVFLRAREVVEGIEAWGAGCAGGRVDMA